jgi:hypothetical protein
VFYEATFMPFRLPARSELSFSLWRKLLQQVRPVARDNAAYLVIDGGGVVVAFLDLPAKHFKVLRADGATVQEFHWHVRPTHELGRCSRIPARNERVNVHFFV